LRARTVVATLVAVVLSLSGCSMLEPGPDECRAVDEGGECFAPSRAGIVEHALASTRAWPQLDGLAIEAGEVVEGFDAAADAPTWMVPLRSNGKIVAASRFLPFENEVRLGEVALYLPARDEFPTPAHDERLVIFTQDCGDPLPETCLFREHAWRIEQAP
jgi:hypothetical protein